MKQTMLWCPPSGSAVPLGFSQTTVHRDEVIVAGDSTKTEANLEGKFLYPDGTIKDQ
jgi:hypothetical protein